MQTNNIIPYLNNFKIIHASQQAIYNSIIHIKKEALIQKIIQIQKKGKTETTRNNNYFYFQFSQQIILKILITLNNSLAQFWVVVLYI